MSEEDKIPYLVVNENGDTFTFYVKGTKPYLDLQQRIDKAIEYIKEHIRIDDEYPDYMEMLIEERNELLQILGDKENE